MKDVNKFLEEARKIKRPITIDELANLKIKQTKVIKNDLQNERHNEYQTNPAKTAN